MALPYLDNPATLDPATAQELDGLVAKTNAYLRLQHNEQGGHGDISATSLVVDGPVTVRDERDAPSTFARSVADGTRIDIAPGTGNDGFAFRFGDKAHPFQRALIVLPTGGHYEVRPDTTGPEVWLGGAGGVLQQFIRGYIQTIIATTVFATNVSASNVGTVNTFERGRSFSAGDWVDVPFNAANFTTDTGAIWSVSAANVGYLRYTIIGQTMHYAGFISGTSVGAPAPIILQVALPAGYVAPRSMINSFMYSDAGGGHVLGFAQTAGTGTAVQLVKLPTTQWTVGGPTNVYFDIAIEVTG